MRALRGVSLALAAGEVHALVGENGAGKSTLIKIFTGAVAPDGGEIRLRGELLEQNSPAKARSHGIAAIYQQPALFPDLTVAENIALGKEGQAVEQSRLARGRRTRANYSSESARRIRPAALAGELSMPRAAARRNCEGARCERFRAHSG